MMAVAPIREVAMRAQTLAHEVIIDRVDLEALETFLTSDRSPPDGMMLSELDGHRDCNRAESDSTKRMAATDLGRCSARVR